MEKTFQGMKPILIAVSSIDALSRQAVLNAGGSLYPFVRDEIDVVLISLPWDMCAIERLDTLAYKVSLLTKTNHIILHIVKDNEHSDDLDAHRLKCIFVEQNDIAASLLKSLDKDLREILDREEL